MHTIYTDIHRSKVHACNPHITDNERTIMRMTGYPHRRDQCMAVRNRQCRPQRSLEDPAQTPKPHE